jgi:hypothetical protein
MKHIITTLSTMGLIAKVGKTMLGVMTLSIIGIAATLNITMLSVSFCLSPIFIVVLSVVMLNFLA